MKISTLKLRAPLYFDFDAGRELPNFRVPREGRVVRVTTPKGDLIRLGRRKVRHRYRVQYQKIDYNTQLSHAFTLFDESIRVLEEVGCFKLLKARNYRL